MRSLLAPLIVGLLLSLAAVVGVQWSMVRAAVDAMMIDYIAEGLAEDADELFDSIAVLPDGNATLALVHFDPPFLRPHSGRYFQVLSGDRIALKSMSLGEDALPMSAVRKGERRVAEIPGPAGETLLLSAGGYEYGGRAITIAVADDLAPIRARFQRLMARYTRVSLLMAGLLVVLQVAIVRIVLAPLRAVQADVARLERGEIAQLGERVPSELLPLVREVNRLLALLTQRLQRSREALGNLAHALKAPLSVLTHIADDPRLQQDAALAREIHGQLGQLRDRVDSELRRARVAGGAAAGNALDVAQEIEALLATLRKLYPQRQLALESHVEPGLRFRGDREDFLELAGNLLDNACKWAVAHVRITLRANDGLHLVVEDDGPGCSADSLTRLAQRGLRLDENTEGHGLGLSIVEGIVTSYGGRLEFGRSAGLGGLAAIVWLPSPH